MFLNSQKEFKISKSRSQLSFARNLKNCKRQIRRPSGMNEEPFFRSKRFNTVDERVSMLGIREVTQLLFVPLKH